jgi:C-terminal processing protease CtpA/Prc
MSRSSGLPRLVCRLVLGSMLVSTGIGAQGFDPDRTHPVAALREDFALLRRALEEAHAGLYRYSSKADIDRMFDDAAARLRGPMTELEFLRVLGPVVGGVNDGHTGWSPSPGLSGYLGTQPILLPFALRFVDGRAYLFQDLSDEPALEMGVELTHLNGLAMGDVVARLLPFISSDGRVVTSKYRRALENASTFGRLYGIAFGVTTRFELTYRPMGGGAPETVTVRGITTAQLRQRFAERYPQAVAAQSRPPIEFAWRDGVPILTVRTFGGGLYGRAGIDYAGFLRDAFAELAERGAERLVIDVRGNGGGSDDYGKLLAAHLLNRPFDYYAALEINAPSFSFMEYTDQPRWTMPANQVRANARGVYDVLGHPNLGPQQPAEPVFGGDVIILIDGGSFSATGEFTSVVHHLGRATFVGEESGAGYYGNVSGGGATLSLPTTRVRVRIPFIRYSCAVSGYEPTDRGLMPDHEVTPTIEDLLAERDPAMEFALGLARRR